MKSLRWGLIGVVLGGAVLFSGCQSPFKMVPRAEYDHYRQLKELNQEQANLVTALTYDKERLTNELNAARAQLGDKTSLLRAQENLLKELQEKTRTTTAAMPGGAEGITPIATRYGAGLRMEADVLFAPGQASLTPEGEKVLAKAAAIVANEPNALAINGYSDSDPIRHSGWKSNFELSGARALAVLESLRKHGIAPERMHFAGYGEHDLIIENGKENKKKSRRAEIILLNELGSSTVRTTHTPAPPKAPVQK